ncbi:MAG: hypothetical protein HY264_05070 [Chloroflexi bacterium]|nr:hypothetical protein [Chloroflexota bacterium]
MSPILGVSWADIISIVEAYVAIALLLAMWWWFVTVNVPTSDGAMHVAGMFASLIPLLFLAANEAWLRIPGVVAWPALVPWLVALVIVRRRIIVRRVRLVEARRRAAEAGQPGLSPDEADGAPLPVGPASTAAASPVRGRRRWRGPAVALVMLASLIVAPRAIYAISSHTPCETAEILLAAGNVGVREAEPEAWMPPSVPGYVRSDGRATTLGTVAASRKNPDASRSELRRDGFVAGYEERWDGAGDHLEFDAQQFATAGGASAFQAFAVRYACQFANEAFPGPDGSVGLQIRFATGNPIGEQVSWVSGTTRIIVFADFRGPPTDHGRILALVRLITR